MSASYIYDAVRTPFGRLGKGLAGIRPDDLAAHNLRALLERHPDVDPARIDDVILGDANQAGEDNRNVGRFASLLAIGFLRILFWCTILEGNNVQSLWPKA